MTLHMWRDITAERASLLTKYTFQVVNNSLVFKLYKK